MKSKELEILDHGKKISEAELIYLEELIGAKLPFDYREFMLENNGGRPSLTTFSIENFGEDDGEIAWFYDISSDDTNGIVDAWRDQLETGINQHLPIAYSSFGDQISMNFSTENFGEIWWRDDRLSWGNRSNANAYTKIANTFNDFLKMLKLSDVR